jgi:undecaprenyl diphosphate synthase
MSNYNSIISFLSNIFNKDKLYFIKHLTNIQKLISEVSQNSQLEYPLVLSLIPIILIYYLCNSLFTNNGSIDSTESTLHILSCLYIAKFYNNLSIEIIIESFEINKILNHTPQQTKILNIFFKLYPKQYYPELYNDIINMLYNKTTCVPIIYKLLNKTNKLKLDYELIELICNHIHELYQLYFLETFLKYNINNNVTNELNKHKNIDAIIVKLIKNTNTIYYGCINKYSESSVNVIKNMTYNFIYFLGSIYKQYIHNPKLLHKISTSNTENPLFKMVISYIGKYKSFYWDIIKNGIKYCSNNTYQPITLNRKIHIGAILDGNRRYSNEHSIDYSIGYLKGAQNVKNMIDWCISLQCINMLTIYVLSIDNYINRPTIEKDIIFKIVILFYEDLIPYFLYNKIKVTYIGNIKILPIELQERFNYVLQQTNNIISPVITLNIAVGYIGRNEIVTAVQRCLQSNTEITVDNLSKNMDLTREIDLVIRTGGMKRSSGFCTWQTTYSEWFYLNKYWPELDYNDLSNIVNEFKQIPRNYGK